MSKKIITTTLMPVKKAHRVAGVKAPGNQILVEMLRPEEASESCIELPERTAAPNQGYIVDIGPAVKLGEYGFEVGDRVLLQGNFVPTPWKGESGRLVVAVDGYTIKCILQEDQENG